MAQDGLQVAQGALHRASFGPALFGVHCFEAGHGGFGFLAIFLEMGAAGFGNGEQAFAAFRGHLLDVAEVFQGREGGVNHAWAWRVGAAGAGADFAYGVVAVARGFLQKHQDDHAKATGFEVAAAAAAASLVSWSVVWAAVRSFMWTCGVHVGWVAPLVAVGGWMIV